MKIVVMDKNEFYRLYIPAIEEAFKNDHINPGFHVKGPEYYIEPTLQIDVEKYIESNEDTFLEKIAYYFDAKSHNFPNINGIEINEYRQEIIMSLAKLKEEFANYESEEE